jgi:hypothetical protein
MGEMLYAFAACPGLSMKMPETRMLQNERALTRLTKAFPASVLTYALNRRWTRPVPRLAIAGHCLRPCARKIKNPRSRGAGPIYCAAIRAASSMFAGSTASFSWRPESHVCSLSR